MTRDAASSLEQAVNAEVCSVCEGHEDDHTGCANAVQHFLRQSEAARDGAHRELKRVEAVRANSERVAHTALALAEEVYGWAVHEPNHHRLLGRLAELREELSRGA